MAATVAVLISVAIFLLLVGLYQWLGWTREVDQRLVDTVAPAVPEDAKGGGLGGALNKRLGKMSAGKRIERQLIAADSQLTVAEYLGTRLLLAAAGFLVGWLISRNMLGGLLLGITGWVLPLLQLRRRAAKRLRSFNDNLSNVLDLLVGSLRAGQGLLTALSVVAEEMPVPVGPEFERVMRETSLGYSVDDALAHLVERVGSPDLELIVTSVHIQHEVGGNLAEVLTTISETIRQRVQLMGEIRALTSSQRMTGTMLSLLPFGVATVLMLINPGYMMPMFQPGWPLLIPAVAIVFVIVGNLVMRRIARLDV